MSSLRLYVWPMLLLPLLFITPIFSSNGIFEQVGRGQLRHGLDQPDVNRPLISSKERRWLRLSLFLSNLVDEAKASRVSVRQRRKRLVKPNEQRVQRIHKHHQLRHQQGERHPDSPNNLMISNDDHETRSGTKKKSSNNKNNNNGYNNNDHGYSYVKKEETPFKPNFEKTLTFYDDLDDDHRLQLTPLLPNHQESGEVFRGGSDQGYHRLSHNLVTVEEEENENDVFSVSPHVTTLGNERPYYTHPTRTFDFDDDSRRRMGAPRRPYSPSATLVFESPFDNYLDVRREASRRGGTRSAASRRRTKSRCPGRCDNAMRCLVQGGKAHGGLLGAACPGLFQVCCTSWRPPPPPPPPPRSIPSSLAPPSSSVGRILGPISYSRPLSSSSSSSSASSSSSSSSSLAAGAVAAWSARRPRRFHGWEEWRGCGVSSHAQRKIMGGSDAGYGQFPWTALIEIHAPGIDKECSGTLVHPRFVLTAGHCTQYCLSLPECNQEVPQHEILYRVRLGEYDLSSDSELLPVEVFTAIDVLRHPHYRNVMRLRQNGHVVESEPRYDVALLLLDRPVTFGPNIAPICLPHDPQEAHRGVSAGRQGVVVGWGRVGREKEAPHAFLLQAATLPVLSDTQCFVETELSNFDDQFCAGGKAAAAAPCPGDSGGAFMMQNDEGKWNLMGVVSNGPSLCGVQPVVFHKVATTLTWMRDVMQQNLPQDLP